jgi:uncharacterized protein (TIGR02001 family)
MNKKTPCLLLGVLALGALAAQAQTPAAAPAPAAPSSSWVLTPGFASQYMFRGTRLGGPSFQPAIEFDSGSLAVGVWANTPISAKVVGQSDPEFDIYGSYTLEAIKDTLTWVPGFTIYTYPDADESAGFYKATYEPSLAVNYMVAGWKFTPKVYYDLKLKGPTFEFTAYYAFPLPDAKTEIDFTAVYGTFKWTEFAPNAVNSVGAPVDVKNVGDYYSVGIAAPFQVTPSSKLTIGWAYVKGSDNFLKYGTDARYANSAAVGRGVVTVLYAITF